MRFATIIITVFALATTAAGQDITTGLAAHYTFDTDGSDETVNSKRLGWQRRAERIRQSAENVGRSD